MNKDSKKRLARVRRLQKSYAAAGHELKVAADDAIMAEMKLFKSLFGSRNTRRTA
jgi:hypothetical protein